MKISILILLLLSVNVSVSVFAAKPPPKPAKNLDCVGCVDTVDIAPQAVTTEKLSQDVQNTLQNVNLNDSRITTNSEGIQTNANAIGANSANVNLNASNINTNASGIKTNADNIDVNATNIGINSSNIDTNATDFQQQIDQLLARISEIESIPRAVIMDANDNIVGTMLYGVHSLSSKTYYSAFKAEGRTFKLVVTGGTTDSPLHGKIVYFTLSGCKGTAYMSPNNDEDLIELGASDGSSIYLVDDPTARIGDPEYVSFTYYSYGDDHYCTDASPGYMENGVTAHPVMDATQFTPPFSIRVLP